MRIVRHLENYTVEQGWSDELARDLVEASHESEIQKYTPHDARRRFRNRHAAQQWYDDPDRLPVVYALRDDVRRQLGGIAWFSQGQHTAIDSSYNTTFAIRLYDIARGKRLSYSFAEAVHEDFIRLPIHKISPNLWLETNAENAPARRVYEKLGYTTLATVDDRIIMGKSTHLSSREHTG